MLICNWKYQFDFFPSFFRHFAFISFVNDNTALDVLRQHAIVPIIFQNHPIILAPAYKKAHVQPSTSIKIDSFVEVGIEVLKG